MLTIWGRSNSINVQKVMWAVGELGLEHRRIDVGGAFGGLDTADYAKLNPNGLVPAIQDGELVVWESNACVRYLAAAYGAGGLWPREPGPRSVADRWMDWQMAELQPLMRTVFWGLVRTPPEQRDAAAIAEAAERLQPVWGRLDAHLQGRSFVAGEGLTMGDIPVGAMFWRYSQLPVERPELRHCAAWFERLRTRDAYRRHVMLPVT